MHTCAVISLPLVVSIYKRVILCWDNSNGVWNYCDRVTFGDLVVWFLSGDGWSAARFVMVEGGVE